MSKGVIVKVDSDSISNVVKELNKQCINMVSIQGKLYAVVGELENNTTSDDIMAFEGKLQGFVNRLNSTNDSLSTFIHDLNTISSRYNEAQTQAIYRAMSIPK